MQVHLKIQKIFIFLNVRRCTLNSVEEKILIVILCRINRSEEILCMGFITVIYLLLHLFGCAYRVFPHWLSLFTFSVVFLSVFVQCLFLSWSPPYRILGSQLSLVSSSGTGRIMYNGGGGGREKKG